MLPRMLAAHIDARAIGFAAVVSLLVAGIYGTLPLLSFLRSDLAGALHDASPTVTLSTRARRLQRGLVTLEIGLALLLLVSASLLLLSFRRLAVEDLGFAPEGLITADIHLNRDRYAEPPAQTQFFRTVLDRLGGMPDGGDTALVQPLPLSGSRWTVGFVIDGRPAPAPSEQRQSNIARVSERYFATAGIRLLRGRSFTAEDSDNRPQVAIIDRAFATAYWPGRDPIGSRIKLSYSPGSSKPWLEIVGVVDSVRTQGAREDAGIQLYVPFWQSPLDRGTLISRPVGRSSAMSQNLRSLVAQIDPDQPVASVSTMEQNLVDTMLPNRLASYLLTAFALIALALAATGIYGVISHSVAQRTSEFSLRMILGATPGLIRRQVAGEVGLLAAAGIGLGLIMVPIVGPLMSHLLFRMSPWEPAVLAGTSVLTIGVALLAGLLASRRITRVEPITGLRYQ
jgi:predicted permease